jgi:hypothetical protein
MEPEKLEKIVETTDKAEAESLMERGYSLVGIRTVVGTEQHCPPFLSPTDWSSYEVEKKLFTLALNP